MKIGIDGRYAEGKLTGIGKYIRQLVLGLASKGIKVVIFYSKKPYSEINGKNIYSEILYSNNRYLFEQVLLPLALRRSNIDIYHAAGNVGIPLFCPCPSVLTVHDIIPFVYSNYFEFSKCPFLSRTSYVLRLKISLSKAGKIISDSEYTKKMLIEKLRVIPSKIYVIGQGIDIKKSSSKVLPFVSGKYILNNGGIDIRKNLPKLLEAFAKISPKFPGLKLVITGENKLLTAKLREISRNLGISNFMIFTGYVDDDTLWTLVKNADCLCFPSEIEGFGLPVLEGLAAGVPVVASNTTSIPEVAGNAALLVNPQSVNEISESLERILTDDLLRVTLVQKGLIQSKKFSWSKTIDETVKIYEEVLK